MQTSQIVTAASLGLLALSLFTLSGVLAYGSYEEAEASDGIQRVILMCPNAYGDPAPCTPNGKPWKK